MSRKAKPAKASRREFLKGAAVISGAATLAVVARGGSAATQDAGAVPGAPEKARGYHETPHVRQYYDKARI
jgi:nitrous oxide reductase